MPTMYRVDKTSKLVEYLVHDSGWELIPGTPQQVLCSSISPQSTGGDDRYRYYMTSEPMTYDTE